MALITAAEARVYIPALTGTAQDTELNTLISRADGVLAAWCGFPPASAGAAPTLEDTTYTLYLDGPGGATLRLPVRPVVSITSIYDDPLRAYAAADLVDSGDYTLYGDDGLVILDHDSVHGGWSTSSRALKVTAVCGFATIPEPIKQAAAMLVGHWYRLKTSLGATSISQAGTNMQRVEATLPDSVKELMAPYRIWVGLL